MPEKGASSQTRVQASPGEDCFPRSKRTFAMQGSEVRSIACTKRIAMLRRKECSSLALTTKPGSTARTCLQAIQATGREWAKRCFAPTRTFNFYGLTRTSRLERCSMPMMGVPLSLTRRRTQVGLRSWVRSLNGYDPCEQWVICGSGYLE